MLRGTESFRAVWAETIYPVIKSDYQALLQTVPSRLKVKREQLEQDQKKTEKRDKKKAAGREDVVFAFDTPDLAIHRKLAGVLADLRETKERRNVYMNLAWTGPVENTRLQEKIPYQKVANMAIDLFMDSSKLAAPANSQDNSQDTDAHQSPPVASLLESMEHQQARPWKIPERVERGFEIPICISDLDAIPAPGEFKRLGMDVVVNAVWLAFFWAKKEGNQLALSELAALIVDWPMDFVLIQGGTPEELEENKFKFAVNQSAAVERLRDFLGLENQNLMRMVATAAEFVSSTLVSGKKAKSELVHKWLVTNVRWGAFNCPDVQTVERHLGNWAAIQKNPKVMELVEAALQRFGRNNLLDWPTKLQTIVTKTDASSLGYVVEALYGQMWRKNVADPYGVQELKRVIPEIIWIRIYTKAVVRKYPQVFNSPPVLGGDVVKDACRDARIAHVKVLLDSPLVFL